MRECFDATRLTPRVVAQKSGFLDWDSQPSRFKHYPDFCYRLSREALGAFGYLLDLRYVSDTQTLGNKPYERLNVPSAGNLHPCELYVQLRGLEGILSGIYHVDAQRRELVLIREIERDGLEPYVGMEGRFFGVIALLSLVPFRSYWKYGARSWRYCYLDAGHQLYVLRRALEGATLCEGFEVASLDEAMGFGSDETSCCAVAFGERGSRACAAMAFPLMQVAPTDYREAFEPLPHRRLLGCDDAFDRTISPSRRSARRFSGVMIDMEPLMHLVASCPLHVSVILWRALGRSSGIYRNGTMIREGDFSRRVSDLLVAQRFVEEGAGVILFHTPNPDESAHLCAGVWGQALYEAAAQGALGCSGIGAYYDDAIAALIETDDAVVYVIAIGGI
ncbi:MAG: hypothetical protein JXK05_06005 [Campylobacterales bacterium]|nr:hypothetical protein [Campylobacterales bacterium]